MRLARRALLCALTTLVVYTIVSAQVLKSDNAPQGASPVPSTGGPEGGPTGLFTIYDGQTLRRGEFTFSVAYSNFDRDPGNLGIVETPLSFNIRLSDYIELFFKVTGYKGIKANSPLNLSGFYLPNSHVFFGNGLLGSPPAIILAPSRPPVSTLAGTAIFRPAFCPGCTVATPGSAFAYFTGGQPSAQYPYMGAARPNFGLAGFGPRFGFSGFSATLGPPVATANNGTFGSAAVFPGVGAPVGGILPGVVLATTTLPATILSAATVVPSTYTTSPAYYPGAPFLNRLYGESSFTDIVFGGKIRFTEPDNPLGVGIIPFYRWWLDKGNDFGGFNQLQRGAGPGGDIGDFGLVGFGDARLSRSVNVSVNGGYIPNSNPKDPNDFVPSDPSDDANGFGFQTFAGRRNLRSPEYLPNMAPTVTLSASPVTNKPPCTPGTVSTDGCKRNAERTFQLSANATDPDGDILTYTYTTTSGHVIDNGANVMWDLSGVPSGTYTATVEVDDGCGAISSSSTTVTIADCTDCPESDAVGVVSQRTPENQNPTLAPQNKAEVSSQNFSTDGIRLQSNGNARALSKNDKDLRYLESVNDIPGIIIARQNRANIYYSIGDYQQALDNYNQALSLSRSSGTPQQEANILNSIGKLYNDLGEYSMALANLNKALDLTQKIGDRRGQANTLYDLGNIYFNQRKIQESRNFHERSILLFQVINDLEGESRALNGLGKVYVSLKQYQKALEFYGQALSFAESAGNNSRIVASMLFEIGKVNKALGSNQKALDYYNQALALNQRLVDYYSEAQTRYEIASVNRDIGNLNEAQAQIETALNIVDSLRTNIPSSDLRSTYFATVQKYYSLDIDLLVQLYEQNPLKGFDAMALEVSERARARRLLDLLKESQTDIRQGVDPQLIEQERSLQQELNDKAARQIQIFSSQHTKEQEEAIANEIKVLTNDYRAVQLQVRTQSPRYAALTQPRPLSLKEIREQVLDDDTLLLEYVLGDDRSFLFALSSNSNAVYVLPKRSDIEAVALEAYGLLASRNQQSGTLAGKPSIESAETQYKEVCRRLSQMLLGPIADQLGTKRLLIVAQGALQRVPFGALPVPESASATKDLEYRPLIVDHEIVNLPSASTLAVLRQETAGRKPAPKAIAVLADPVVNIKDERITAGTTRYSGKGSSGKIEDKISQNLPRLLGSRWEANQIISLFSPSESMLALDFAADRETALNSDLSQYRIVHFATHGFINEEHPELSGIVLSLFNKQGQAKNGFLRLNEIYNMHLPVELVVLSGCQTGNGKEINGEGLIGLTRGFMYAGAPRIVFSLWSVDDQATADLMVKFYRKMLKEKLRPAAALRAAQIEMWKDSRWKSPYFWAAFMFQGEWR